MTEAEVLKDLESMMDQVRTAISHYVPEPEVHLGEEDRLVFLGASVYAKLVAEWRALKRGRRGNGEGKAVEKAEAGR